MLSPWLAILTSRIEIRDRNPSFLGGRRLVGLLQAAFRGRLHLRHAAARAQRRMILVQRVLPALLQIEDSSQINVTRPPPSVPASLSARARNSPPPPPC